MAVIIEVNDLITKGTHRYILDHDSISLGRAYTNDIVLDDPYVDLFHAKISASPEGFELKDCESLNGIQNSKRCDLPAASLLKSGDCILIGQTKIRLFDSDHPLPDAIPLHQPGSLANKCNQLLSTIWVSISLAFIVWLLEVERLHLSSFREEDYNRYLSASVTEILGLFVLAGCFSLVSKVALKEWHFSRNLGGISLIVFFEWLLKFPANTILFNYNLSEHIWLFEQGVAAIEIGLFAFVFLTNLPIKQLLHKSLICSSLIAACMGYFVVAEYESYLDQKHFIPSVTEIFTSTQLPFSERSTQEEFITESKKIFDIPIKDPD